MVVGVVLERMARGLARVPVSRQIVGTVGLLLLIRALATWIYGPEYKLFEPFLSHRTAFTVSGVAVTEESVITFVTVSAAAVGLSLLVERTRLGTTMRAVVDDPALLDTTGIAPARVRRQAWLLGSCFAAASGVLLASQQQQLDATLLSLLVVQAFGAAALGAFRSLPMQQLTPAAFSAVGIAAEAGAPRRTSGPRVLGCRAWTSTCRSWCCSSSCWCSVDVDSAISARRSGPRPWSRGSCRRARSA